MSTVPDSGVAFEHTRANGIDITLKHTATTGRDDSQPARRVAAAFDRADPSVDRISTSAVDAYDAKIWLADAANGSLHLDLPDRLTVQRITQRDSGAVIAKVALDR